MGFITELYRVSESFTVVHLQHHHHHHHHRELTNMLLFQLKLCNVLLIIAMLNTLEVVTAGCDDWKIQGEHVCCDRCSLGNHLVARCGPDRSKLCAPCESNTYTRLPLALYCLSCSQCIAPLVQLKPCNASADTVCGCKPGFLCANQQCTYCVEECKKGQEPTDERDCRKCPDGSFNDEIHRPCKAWRERCPEGEQIIASGTEFSDIKCGKKTSPSFSPSQDNSIYPLVGFFSGSCALMFVIILFLWLAYRRTKNKRKDLKPTTLPQGELTIMTVEHEEACSFHQPEQEQGGSSESINTQDSETKLIV